MSAGAAAVRKESASQNLPVFLTAYDPSDLPGASLDPLGFERGYLFLADKILPGLTNVADRPRYFSVLCAGAYLAEVDGGDPPRRQYQRRLDCILRFERLWALANVLASTQESDDERALSGVRGVTYAAAKAEALHRTGARRVDADFPLLSRQTPYGAVGMYGVVADGMRFLDRKTLTLTPDLGERLAEEFLNKADTPPSLKKAVREKCEMPLAALTEWGRRAHVSGAAFPAEKQCLHEALHRDPVRSRMAAVLADYPFGAEDEFELERLKRLQPALAREPSYLDLKEAVSAILAYEECYQLAMLGFERLLWLCRIAPGAAPASAELNADAVLRLVCKRMPASCQRFRALLESGESGQFVEALRLEDARRFLDCASACCDSPESLTREIVSRHSDVQRGKFDRGRRKMPWLEMTAGRLSLTMTRVGGLDYEATQPSDIVPHPYRLRAADALIEAARDS